MGVTSGADETPMPTYLTKREGTYYFRRVIPKELQSVIGKTAFVWSLKTKNLAEAKKLRNRDAIKTDTDLERAAASLRPVQATSAPIPPDRQQFDGALIQRDAARIAASFRRYLQQAAVENRLVEARREVADTLSLHRDNLATGFLIDQIDLAQSEAYSLALQSVLNPEAAPILPPLADARPSPNAIQLKDVVGLWAKAKSPTAKSVRMWTRTVDDFAVVGGDKPIDQITKRDVIGFVDQLSASGKSPATIDNRLNQLRALFRFAASRDLIAADPTQGVQPPPAKSVEKARHPWSVEAMNSLFAGPVHRELIVPEGGKGAAAYFLPLLALFTGARLNELGQLRPKDVVEERFNDPDGNTQVCWVMRFVEDKAEGLKLKTPSSARRIPVHPELQRLGLIRLVEQAKARGDKRLFPKLEADAFGTVTASWGKWFGRYNRLYGTPDPKVTFHSFRHNFKDICRAVGASEDVHDAITGHTDGRVARKYGGLDYPLGPMVKVMDSYKVHGLVLPDPFM